MIIREKNGTLHQTDTANRQLERIGLEWHETGKKIMHKKTDSGRAVILKLFGESESLAHDDVVYADEALVIAVDILPTEAIVLQPASLRDMALICYELGNKHLPLFYDDGELSMPYDGPVFTLLSKAGYNPVKQSRRLLHPMRTSVAAHRHEGVSLFSRILQLTTPSDAP